MMARKTDWGWDANQNQGRTVDLRVGLDLYNASDQRRLGQLAWRTTEGVWPPGWLISPRPLVINPADAINTYHVRRFNLDVAVKVDELAGNSNKPLELTFTDDLTSHVSPIQIVAPVAVCDHRGNGPLKIDGDLKDWSQADTLQNGPLIRMMNRPSIQKQDLERSTTSSQIYSGWGNDSFYLAFTLHGCQGISGGAETNFIQYPLGRAWGEDVVETLVQALYADGTAGPILHIAAKPRGSCLVERKPDPRQGAAPWQSVAGEAILYGATVDTTNTADPIWRGEIAIPWEAINDPRHPGAHPMLMKFNFAQHKNITGESASWAGPIDSGRDENFTGLLYLRDPINPARRPE